MSSEIFAEALDHYRYGRFQRAAEQCARILEADPQCAEALHLLGLIASQTGALEAAVGLIGRAIQHNPAVPGFFNDLAIIHRKLEQTDRAIACYREALRLDPDYLRAHRNLGQLLLRGEQWEEALEHFRRVISLSPLDADAHSVAGAILADLDRPAEAEECFRQAVSLMPDSSATHTDLGKILRTLQRPGEAELCFRRALQLTPDSLSALNELGVTLFHQNQSAESIACFQRALELAPDHAETHCNLGHLLMMERRFTKSVEHLRRAVHLKPDFAEAWNNLAGALQGDVSTRGWIGRDDDDGLEETEQCYRQALALKPETPEIHVNLALLDLMRGRFERGWKEYEWRLKAKPSPRRFPRPLWQGEPLEGRTILLHVEQGMGDTIQFVRFAALVRNRGGRVILLCQKALRPLLVGSSGIDLLLDEDDELPGFDLHAPLLSLPHCLGTHLGNIPADIPYLFPDPDRVAHWRDRLTKYSGLKVGIVWQGNPGHTGDRWRSIPLVCFQPLTKIPGVDLFSLQTGFGHEQLTEAAGGWAISDLDLPFAEKAAAMMNLDLIVACDTAVAHLAGALGRPVWVALPNIPDWRWLMGRLDTPWYPSMRLFRQPGPEQWPEVFQNIAANLTNFALNREKPA